MIDRAIGLIEKLNVLRIPPPGSIVSAWSGKKIQKRKRIHVVSRPASARDALVIQLGHFSEKGLPFHDSDLNRDAEALLPQSLNKLGIGNVRAVRVGYQFDLSG